MYSFFPPRVPCCAQPSTSSQPPASPSISPKSRWRGQVLHRNDLHHWTHHQLHQHLGAKPHQCHSVEALMVLENAGECAVRGKWNGANLYITSCVYCIYIYMCVCVYMYIYIYICENVHRSPGSKTRFSEFLGFSSPLLSSLGSCVMLEDSLEDSMGSTSSSTPRPPVSW